MTVPTTDGEQEFPVSMSFRHENGRLAGTIDDAIFNDHSPMQNLDYRAGLLGFTSRHPESGELMQYRLYVAPGSITGSAETWDWDKRGQRARVAMRR